MALLLGIGYLVFTILLFFIGPFVWPLPSFMPLIVYVSVLLVMLTTGHLVGLRKAPLHASLAFTKGVFLLGALAAIVLIVPSSITYTGRWPWQVFEAIADQRDAYSRLREQLTETQGARGQIVIIRTLAYPFIFAVLPFGVIYWRTLTSFQRILLGLTVLCSLIFSALRGTTRELADVIIIGSSAFLISMYRDRGDSRAFIARSAKFLFRIGILGISVLTILVVRTAARAGDAVSGTSGCLGEGLVCTDYTKFPYNYLPDWVGDIAATFSGYFSQGYYGLGLALDREFVWSKGIGHSPALAQIYEIFTGDPTLAQTAYTARLAADRWPGEYYWSTLPTWLASDLSFWLVPGAMLLLGYLWARSWVDATEGRDDRAAVFFCALMMIIFYFPANNQMMNTLDNYAALVGWGLAWGITRRNAGRVIG
jgi:hypothetical protein